jgi:hypothetical protein
MSVPPARPLVRVLVTWAGYLRLDDPVTIRRRAGETAIASGSVSRPVSG